MAHSAFQRYVEAPAIKYVAKAIDDNKAEFEPMLDGAATVGVEQLVTILEHEDTHLFGPIFGATLNAIVNQHKTDLEMLIPSAAGQGVDQLVNALNALASKLSA